MLLDRYATYTGSDPRRAPAALAVDPVRRADVRRLVRARAACAGSATPCTTGRLRAALGCAPARDVTRVAGRGRPASAASGSADGERRPADVVVANVDAVARCTATCCPRGRGRARAARCDRATPSLSGFVLLLALRGRTPGLAHHTVLFPADYDAEFDAVFGRDARPVDDPTVYVSAPDDPALRPDDDHEAWFVLVNAPRHGAGPRRASTGTSAGARRRTPTRSST